MYTQGDLVINVNDIINNIQPKILVLIMAFVTYYLLAKKHVSVNKLMILMLIISVIGYFTTILA